MILLLAVGYAAACYKWGAWRRWQDFYNTILYVIIGDLAYQFVFSDYKLWIYTGFLGHTYTALIVMFLVFPSAIVLFLTYFPDGFINRALYITVWSIANTLIEVLACITDGLQYEHGWNIAYSFMLFFIAFNLIWMHYKKSFWVWPISLICGIACTLIFGLPPCY